MSYVCLPDFEFVFVEGGNFMMGSNAGLFDHEKPAHCVQLSSFYIGKFPVTQLLWQTVMGYNPSSTKLHSDRPVDCVSWNDAQEFLTRMNDRKDVQYFIKCKSTVGTRLRLPTEAEWEFAARGGNRSQGYEYAGSNQLKQVGWYKDNSCFDTRAVGRGLSNELELHDMSGNVYEWCSDWYSEKYYEECFSQGITVDPAGPTDGTAKIMRGGSHQMRSVCCRSIHRDGYWPEEQRVFIGFRLAF